MKPKLNNGTILFSGALDGILKTCHSDTATMSQSLVNECEGMYFQCVSDLLPEDIL